MSELKYYVYWTDQVTKKNKIWNSGVLSWFSRNSAGVLYDERGKELCQTFIVGGVIIGKEYQFEKYLVTAESLLQDVNKQQQTAIPVISKKKKFVSPLKKPAHVHVRRPIYSKEDLEEDEGVSNSEFNEAASAIQVPNNPAPITESITVPSKQLLEKPFKPKHALPAIDWNIFLRDAPKIPLSEEGVFNRDDAFSPVGDQRNLNSNSFGTDESLCTQVDCQYLQPHSVYAHTSQIEHSIAADDGNSEEQHDENVSSVFYKLSRKLSRKKPPLDLKELKLAEDRNVDEHYDKMQSSSDSVRMNASNITNNLNNTFRLSESRENNGKRVRLLPPQDQEIVEQVLKPKGVCHSSCLTWTCENICFPSLSVCNSIMPRGKPPARSTVIPFKFSSIQEYKNIFSAALYEEINNLMARQALLIRTSLNKLVFNLNCFTKSQLSRVESELLKIQIHSVYYNCHFLASKKSYIKNRFFLKISENNFKLHTRDAFNKDDVWIVSNTPLFEIQKKSDFLLICHSLNHGKLKKMELQCVHPTDGLSSAVIDGIEKEKLVYAVHGPNVSSEICMLNCLNSVSTESTPLLPMILEGKNKQIPRPFQEFQLDKSVLDEMCHGFSSKYKLNEEQAEVLRQVSKWFGLKKTEEKNSDFSPIILVHGVFGSGKSYMLVVLIMFLTAVFELFESSTSSVVETNQILVSSFTNVAVDRIMRQLLDNGFTDFLRIGSLKKIDRAVLPYSVHRAKKASKSSVMIDSVAVRELDEILNEQGLDSETKAMVAEKREQIISGAIDTHVASASLRRVIGTTCAASSFPVLSNHIFKVVILDECSQISEPLSLLPITRFGARGLVLVGDPMQLPPQLNSWSPEPTVGLGRALFSRLTLLGIEPIMLKKQYRLHPLVSRLVNELFYEGKLVDGVSESQRAPLVHNIPILAFVNVGSGSESADGTGSIFNHREAIVVVELIKLFTDAAIGYDRIGVICLYKAQVKLIADRLRGKIPAAYNSKLCIATIDSFQGLEKDVIILSCSRTESNTTGFSASSHRINVALTRSRHHLIIVGNYGFLSTFKTWSTIVSYANLHSESTPWFPAMLSAS